MDVRFMHLVMVAAQELSGSFHCLRRMQSLYIYVLISGLLIVLT